MKTEQALPTFEPFPVECENAKVVFRGVVAGRRRVWIAESVEQIWRTIADELPRVADVA